MRGRRMAFRARHESLSLPKNMGGGFASTKRASARSLIKNHLAVRLLTGASDNLVTGLLGFPHLQTRLKARPDVQLQDWPGFFGILEHK
jgi:hypothetical protein